MDLIMKAIPTLCGLNAGRNMKIVRIFGCVVIDVVIDVIDVINGMT